MTRTRTLTTTYAVLCAAALVLPAALAQADFIVRPVGGDNPDGLQWGGNDITRTISGTSSGLSGDLETGDALPATWPTHSTNTGDVCGLNSAQYHPCCNWLQWDLGDVYEMTGFHLWNINNTPDYGFKDITAHVSDNASDWSTVSISPEDLAEASGLASYEGEDYAFDGTVSARYVKFHAFETYKGPLSSNPWNGIAGVSEIRFTAVPEPATMGLIVLGGVGLLLKRRRSRS
ncbi:MAG: discoidin domain-containing protein [Planctomycetota bacterium]